MTAVIRQFEMVWTNGILSQLVRYVLAGMLATLIYAAVYLPLAWWVFPEGRAVLAVPFGFTASVSAGFFLHSVWSFGGHGTRDDSGKQRVKFLLTHCVGLAMNMFFTWMLTSGCQMPAWAPLIPSVTITPLVTFWLQRQWVFT